MSKTEAENLVDMFNQDPTAENASILCDHAEELVRLLGEDGVPGFVSISVIHPTALRSNYVQE